MLSRTFGVLLLGCVASTASAADTAKDVERSVSRSLSQKIVSVRHAYRGTKLRYNSGGELVQGGPPGISGLNGVLQVTRVKLRGTTLLIDGNRAIVGYDVAKQRTVTTLAPGKMHIEITLDPVRQSNDDINRVLSNVFVSGTEHAYDVVPAYWKAFVEHKIAPSEFNGHVTPVVTELEPMRLPRNPGPEWERPRPQYTPDPTFPESARRQKVQGTVLLEIVVDRTGSVAEINIVRPIGSGLDEMAVDAVSKWRFEPARKNGQVVQIAMLVEVSFRLY